MLSCRLPSALKPGDRLRVVAPSGALRELDAFTAGVEIWRSRGYVVELPPDYDQGWGYLAGTDDQRRQGLLEALADPHCRGVLCTRGGFGGTRLLEEWQWPLGEPKWLIGFSDITSLLWSWAGQGVAGVHGPLLTTLAAEPDWSRQRLFDWVEGNALSPLTGQSWGTGRARGPLLPANLTVATHLLGTIHEPPLRGAILALEDVTEAPYRLDRMLTHWRMMGKLQGLAGVALGRFSRCDPLENVPSFTVVEVLKDRLRDLGIPILAELPFGHDGVNGALPVGVMATLDCDRGTLSIP
ncbi:LD-carboxypeptidase [Leptolyngbya sp. PCC 6406]|uniref:S66 peptidase family protein n=1 Tax=Leptolyngbya sp. PCC 6406 TaxID=1173264 RepID=UPI0002AC481E|nr:LD-carboxypeptidase [Leptolyngbya sp. PCC 6406]